MPPVVLSSVEQGGSWKIRVDESRELGDIMQQMSKLAEALPEDAPEAGLKGRGNKAHAKEAPLRQRLLESWDGKVGPRLPHLPLSNPLPA